jgi:PAS domain S-box-containing protein
MSLGANQLKILVIDDRRDNLTTLEAVLTDALPGCTFLTASNGPRGIALAREADPDAILLDIVMTKMDGFEVCRLLKADDRLREIPVIFLTALGTDREARVKALEAGAEAFLTKPPDELELLAQLRAMAKLKIANRMRRLERDDLAALVAERTQHLERELAARRRAEHELAQTTVLLEHAGEKAGVGGWELDVASGRLTLSKEAARIHEVEFSEERLSVAQGGEYYSPEVWPVVRNAVQAAIEQGTAYDLEVPFITAKGNHLWVHVTGFAVRENGKTVKLRGLFRDITARKRAEEAIGREEKRSSALIENAPDGIAFVSTDGKFAYASPTAHRIFGYDADVMSQLDPNILTHPDDLPRVLAVLSGVVQNPSLVTTLQYRFRHQDGRWLWIESTFSNLIAEPSIQAIVINFRDITARKQAEDALRESEARFKAIANYAVSWESWFGPEGKYIWVNPAVEHFTGYSAQEILALPDFASTVIAEEDRAVFLGRFQEAIRGSREDNFEFRYLHKNGTKRWLSASWQPIFDAQGNPLGTRSSGYDITARKQAEEALRASQQLAESIIESIPGAFYMLDEAGQYVRWNAFQRNDIVGKPDDQIAGFPAIDTIHPNDRALIQTRIANVLRTGAVETVEGRVLLRGGPEFQWLLMTGRQLVVAGHPYLVGIGIDITARKQAEEALRESEQQLRLINDNVRDTIWLMDLGMRTTWISQSVIRTRGYTLAELADMPLDRHLTPASLTRMMALAAVHFTPERLADPNAEISVSVELEYYRKDGSTFWGDSSFTLLRDQDGKPSGFLGVGRDITERKRADVIRQESEDRYKALFNRSNDLVYIHDFEGRFIDANSAALNRLGYTKEELRSVSFATLLSADQYALAAQVLQELQAIGVQTSPTEFRLRTKTGGQIWVETQAAVIMADGKVVAIQGIGRDVTERKQAEQARAQLEEQLRASQKMEAIGSLAGGVAHDFNNLLSVILGYTGFAMEGVRDGDPIKNDLLEVKQAGERAAALTRQLLAFSRKQVLQPVAIDLNQIAAGVEKMLQRILGEDIDLVQTLAPDLGLTLADPGQIEQVLMNLVVNARDAMPEGGKLTIETSNVEIDEEYAARHVAVTPGSYVQLAVSDTGCGMDEQTRERIFEPFFTTKERGKGTGLGLSTVYGIVKQSGGNIWVYSEPGQGTTFKIYLPRAPSATTATAIEPTTIRAPSTGTETILVVEDEEALRKVALRALEAAGFKVLTAADGNEALMKSAQHAGDIQLLLTDVVMPGMSGRVLAQELAKTRPTVKVVYMSGYTDNAIVHHGVLDAGTHFLAKPFTLAGLTQKVREALDIGVTNLANGREQAIEDEVEKKEQPLDKAALR